MITHLEGRDMLIADLVGLLGSRGHGLEEVRTFVGCIQQL